MNANVKFLISRYADFKGSASRGEYLFFQFFGGAILYLSIWGGAALHLDVIPVAAFLLTWAPMTSAAVRRAHDLDRSGWVIFIPFYGWILALSEGG